jgi:hypothetical protein
MYLKPVDDQRDQNMWNLWLGQIRVGLADGSAYAELEYRVTQR